MRCMVLGLMALAACTPEPAPFDLSDELGTTSLFDVAGPFWASPFPSDHRVDPETRQVRVGDFPNPDGVPFVSSLVGMLDDQVQGWSISAAMYLPFAEAVRADDLPTYAGSIEDDALAYVINVDAESPDRGKRFPVQIVARSTPSPWGPRHALVALPMPGLALPPRTRFAFVAHRLLLDANGDVLDAPPALSALLEGTRPEGWRQDVTEQYLDAISVLTELGLEHRTVAALSVFTTGGVDREGPALLDAAVEAGGLRLIRSPEISETELHPDYCIYESVVDVPVFQGGVPPYSTEGGGFVWDETSGKPLMQERQRSRLVITVPRVPTGSDARPTVVFVRTGGGGDRPMLDRGVRNGEGVAEPLSGYAGTFARAGWVGVQLDGPLGGLYRNPDGADEQFLLFNVANPVAMRDNLRQTALELALVPNLLRNLTLTAGDCDGLTADIRHPVRFDLNHLVLFGHSMGATVAPLTAALQPEYEALILSGAGGSWIENIVHKQKPIPTRPIAATMLGESEADVDRYHPVLSLLQWAGESSDPPIVSPKLLRDAETADMRHILMFQGVADHYIPPPVANAMSVALGLDLAGPALDAATAEPGRDALSDLAWVNGTARTLPGGLNRGDEDRGVTALLLQLAEDGVEDGHEVAFQVPSARHQVRCFLEGLVDGIPLVPLPADEGSPCPVPPSE